MLEVELTAFETPDFSSAHVIVIASATDNSGKSMVSILISIALLRAGFNVATIDLDRHKRTMTRFFENRQILAANPPWEIELPFHQGMGQAVAAQAPRDQDSQGRKPDDEAAEFAAFAKSLGEIEHNYEFIVIDTPATFSPLTRLANSLADTLVSPLDLSLMALDDKAESNVLTAYVELVHRARQKRKAVDSGLIDWVILGSQSTPERLIAPLDLPAKAQSLRARSLEGLREKRIFQELFTLGLTALDPIEEATSTRTLLPSQLAARREIEDLVMALQLPERGKDIQHSEARRIWFRRVADFYHNLNPED
jgi:chromosome partitioning protein